MTDSKAIIPFVQSAITVEEAQKVLQDIRAKLGRKTPKNIVRYRPGPIDRKTGKRMQFGYVPPAYVAQRLNAAFGPAWTFEKVEVTERALPSLKKRDGSIVERVEIQFRGNLITPFGSQYAVAGHTWYPDNDEQLMTDAEQAAASKALKRAAARLGVALDLYFDDEVPDDAAPADDTKAVWRAACAKLGLTEGNAVAMVSEFLTGDMNGLTSLDDICTAIEGDAFDAAKKLEEARASLTEIEGEYREVPA